ncbi:hypothetical protein EJ06DRAFT_372226 [Trichodelitschia bisporula]|uniref:RING-type E3 ubiquitin transferase n=1 Tax=Trichodelitschia bisporula TaxID=703511 RepID=A0A6G1I144_9PEZI|nr:hypothetical protein EJ06DRAFT_372226 [Trichodelitschia bisporula]
MSQRPAARELVFCHRCENEWYRDEHGLQCPRCTSDFIEIIDEGHDPRDAFTDDEGDDFNPNRFFNDFHHDLHHHVHDHHHHAHDDDHLHTHTHDAPDPEEDVPNSGFRIRPTGPNSYSISGTYIQPGGARADRNVPPQYPNADDPASLIGTLGNVMLGMVSGANLTRNEGHIGPHGGRFTYTTTFGVRNGPPTQGQPPADPQELHQLFQQFAAPPPPFMTGQLRVPPGFGLPGQPGANRPANPIAQLLNVLLNQTHGDAVYSQEAFDRVLTQLMEQNGSDNAPGPASQDAIASLPRKKVDVSMLDDQGRGECSICMDEVKIGEEVTQLYCTHWFHGQCVGAWLCEHNTCPHCRMGIEEGREAARNKAASTSESNAGPSTATSTSDSSVASDTHTDRDTASLPEGNGGHGSGGGITGRVRSFFGRHHSTS